MVAEGQNMKRFGFIDSSGIINQDRFFTTGFLLISNVGEISNLLCKNYQSALNTVKANKAAVISRLIAEGKQAEVIRILDNSKRFEMKFDNIKPSTLPFYVKMIEIFFSDKSNRFSAMVVDKNSPSFDARYAGDSWEAYTSYSASLAVRELGNLRGDAFCIIVDEITKPKCKAHPLEMTILDKIRRQITYRKLRGIKPESIFGVLSIESHSNMLMQLSDVLLGAVAYEYKKRYGLSSSKIMRRKEPLLQVIRNSLNLPDLAHEFTMHSPLYFSVFEGKWRNKKAP